LIFLFIAFTTNTPASHTAFDKQLSVGHYFADFHWLISFSSLPRRFSPADTAAFGWPRHFTGCWLSHFFSQLPGRFRHKAIGRRCQLIAASLPFRLQLLYC